MSYGDNLIQNDIIQMSNITRFTLENITPAKTKIHLDTGAEYIIMKTWWPWPHKTCFALSFPHSVSSLVFTNNDTEKALFAYSTTRKIVQEYLGQCLYIVLIYWKQLQYGSADHLSKWMIIALFEWAFTRNSPPKKVYH